MNVDKDVETLEVSNSLMESVKWCSYFGKKEIWQVKKLNRITIWSTQIHTQAENGKRVHRKTSTNS